MEPWDEHYTYLSDPEDFLPEPDDDLDALADERDGLY